MLVSEAITLLKTTELKQLKVSEDVPTVIGYINLGILELYKRFLLWEAEATITQADGVLMYTLDGTDSNVDIDLSDHNMLIIERVYDEDNLPYIINNENDEDSISTPQYNKIKLAVVPSIPGYKMKVVYRASPIFLTADTQPIPLPIQFTEALFNYVSYKGHGSVKSDTKGENNTLYMRFEASCNRINREGLFPQKDLVSTKFDSRGFV